MTIHPEEIYSHLEFPAAPVDRPYTFINMVSTIDGKTVSGTDQEPVGDLGSDIDHQLMRKIEWAADAIFIGAGNLRSVPGLWYPKDKYRIVATNSGNLNYGGRFFTDAPDKVIVICPEVAIIKETYKRITNDFPVALRTLRKEYGIEKLLVEGGSTLNAQLLAQNLIDELFLSLAPKIKLGKCLPTYAGGEPLPRGALQNYRLLEYHVVGDELFIRYRRKIES